MPGHRYRLSFKTGSLAKAKGAIERKDIVKRTEQISKATSIVMELKGSLDLEKGGEIAANLDSLYAYMTRRLIEANHENSVEKVQEVTNLLSEILQGWVDIPPAYHKQFD